MNLIRSTMFKVIANSLAVVVTLLSSGCGAPVNTNEKNALTFTKNNFQAEVLSSTQPVLVDFWATWCGPCRMVAPTVAELAREFEGRVKVGKVDVDTEPALAKEYNISAIPALIIFKDGKVVEQFVGVRSKDELKAALTKVVAAPETSTPTP